MNKFFITTIIFCVSIFASIQAETEAPATSTGPANGVKITADSTDKSAKTGDSEAGKPQEEDSSKQMIFFIVVMIGAMYFFMIRPQKKEAAKRKAMVDALKVGDRIITIGGMHGKIVRQGETDFDIELAKDIVVTFNSQAINAAPEKIEEK